MGLSVRRGTTDPLGALPRNYGSGRVPASHHERHGSRLVPQRTAGARAPADRELFVLVDEHHPRCARRGDWRKRGRERWWYWWRRGLERWRYGGSEQRRYGGSQQRWRGGEQHRRRSGGGRCRRAMWRGCSVRELLLRSRRGLRRRRWRHLPVPVRESEERGGRRVRLRGSVSRRRLRLRQCVQRWRPRMRSGRDLPGQDLLHLWHRPEPEWRRVRAAVPHLRSVAAGVRVQGTMRLSGVLLWQRRDVRRGGQSVSLRQHRGSTWISRVYGHGLLRQQRDVRHGLKRRRDRTGHDQHPSRNLGRWAGAGRPWSFRGGPTKSGCGKALLALPG